MKPFNLNFYQNMPAVTAININNAIKHITNFQIAVKKYDDEFKPFDDELCPFCKMKKITQTVFSCGTSKKFQSQSKTCKAFELLKIVQTPVTNKTEQEQQESAAIYLYFMDLEIEKNNPNLYKELKESDNA